MSDILFSRRRSFILLILLNSYFCRFDEFDEAIDEAIEDDIKEADGGGELCGRGYPLGEPWWRSGWNAVLQADFAQCQQFDPDRLQVDSAFPPSEVGKMKTQIVVGKRLTLQTI
ncbi:Remodeling and spacing factor 1, partial [Ophiophagus hannah]